MNSSRLYIAIFSLGMLSQNFLWAGSGNGVGVAESLNLAVDARAAGMAEAFTAVSDEASSVYWNAAALTQVKNFSITGMHAIYLESSRLEFGAFAKNLGRFGSVGVGYQYFSAGSVDLIDINNLKQGDFSPSDQAISLGYAVALGKYSIGVTGKKIQSKIINSAATWTGEVGFLTPSYFSERLRFGIMSRNLFGSLKYNNESEDLSRETKAGLKLQLARSWIVSADSVFPKTGDKSFSAGTEYMLGSEKMGVALRGGYSNRYKNLDGLTGLSLGAGLSLQTLRIDYAFVPLGDVGITHRISLTFNR